MHKLQHSLQLLMAMRSFYSPKPLGEVRGLGIRLVVTQVTVRLPAKVA